MFKHLSTIMLFKTFSTTAMFACVFALGCQSTSSDPQSWTTDMQGFAKVLAEAMPILHKNTPLVSEDRTKITNITERLLKLSRSVNHNKYFPSQDPTFIRASEAMEAELTEIRQELKEGKDRSATRRLASATQYCISCHTMREGYEGELSRNWNHFADHLAPVHRAEFFVATRQFDQALLEYEKTLADQNVGTKNPQEWNASALRMLAVIVRVKNNPNLSLEMLSRFFDAGSYPKENREMARVWRSEVLKWEKAEKRKATPISLASAEKLMNQSAALKPEGAGLIHDLRASRILHLLKSGGAFKDRTEYQKLYLYSGEVAQRLLGLNLWDAPHDYYVICVQRGSDTPTAQKCREGFKNYWTKTLGESEIKKWPKTVQNQWRSIQ